MYKTYGAQTTNDDQMSCKFYYKFTEHTLAVLLQLVYQIDDLYVKCPKTTSRIVSRHGSLFSGWTSSAWLHRNKSTQTNSIMWYLNRDFIVGVSCCQSYKDYRLKDIDLRLFKVNTAAAGH